MNIQLVNSHSLILSTFIIFPLSHYSVSIVDLHIIINQISIYLISVYILYSVSIQIMCRHIDYQMSIEALQSDKWFN